MPHKPAGAPRGVTHPRADRRPDAARMSGLAVQVVLRDHHPRRRPHARHRPHHRHAADQVPVHGDHGDPLVRQVSRAGRADPVEPGRRVHLPRDPRAARASSPTASPVRAMVIGGGEGATVREILRHKTITDCLMVDIDGEVVEECKKHLPEMHQGAFDDPRTRLLHEDARAYLEKTKERFDLIVVDLVEPLEEGPGLPALHQGVLHAGPRPADRARGHDHAGRHDQGQRDLLLRGGQPHPPRSVPGGRAVPGLHLLFRHALGLHPGLQG